MHILNAQQVREWDAYTIAHTPITSLQLMEKAATACVDWIADNYGHETSFAIFCAKGNNGGDGLAIARLLYLKGYKVTVSILEFGKLGTDDFQSNLQRLHELDILIRFVPTKETIPAIDKDEVVIDALYGSGLNRPLDGLSRLLVEHLNNSGAAIISIDLPTGLYADKSLDDGLAIRASHTLTFQCLKPAFLVSENELYTGKLHVLDIGLQPAFLETIKSQYILADEHLARAIYVPRSRFSHKGSHGHSLIIAGSYGKMGAAILASRACIRSGTGLLTVYIPKCGYSIMQIACPEAMVITSNDETTVDPINADLQKYAAIGIGPGIGTGESTLKLLETIIHSSRNRMVFDADALNLISRNIDLLNTPHSDWIITPHPKEMERLFGTVRNDFERIEQARLAAKKYNIVVVLKGKFTCIATPGGMTYFNSTGNAGLAKGGSGDVLTGIITALLANGYSAEGASILGCYLHGKAADLIAPIRSEESMTPGDLIEFIGAGFLSL